MDYDQEENEDISEEEMEIEQINQNMPDHVKLACRSWTGKREERKMSLSIQNGIYRADCVGVSTCDNVNNENNANNTNFMLKNNKNEIMKE